jgi:16S rRNA A1518/A1519 N6-dimethyltransferase RsmA/KsgA/DIM1 with predicted DNA glycosylase/AP lyase activity
MRNSTTKGNKDNKLIYGQYNTPITTSNELINEIEIIDNNFADYVFFEPSFGSGNIIESVFKKYNFNKIIGYEIDEKYNNVIKNYNNNELVNLEIKNFYDSNIFTEVKNLIVFGNPPYRTPAYSLENRRETIVCLKKKYGIKGIKEEAVFFILKTIDIIPEGTNIFYILPKTIFQNPTKHFKTFHNIFKTFSKIVSIKDISNLFENVDQDLVLVHFIKQNHASNDYEIKFNGENISLNKFIRGEDVYTYYDIFKKTNLGSVPAESIFLSCKGESVENFMNRISYLFSDDTIVDTNNVVELLSYQGEPHLSDLKKAKKEKIEKILQYILEIKNSTLDKNIFSEISNFKSILHRKEIRYYFRHEKLKSFSFVYLINPNPGKSFYFTGNPTKISTDYFGFTDYDCNRNSSPGAVRTVLLDDIENNITDSFKLFWEKNSSQPLNRVADYLLEISKSEWWKKRKLELNKQYFSIPKKIIIDSYKLI